MTVYASVVEDILYELRHKEELKAKLSLSDDMYYVYMVGRMTPILEAIVKSNFKRQGEENGSN